MWTSKKHGAQWRASKMVQSIPDVTLTTSKHFDARRHRSTPLTQRRDPRRIQCEAALTSATNPFTSTVCRDSYSCLFLLSQKIVRICQISPCSSRTSRILLRSGDLYACCTLGAFRSRVRHWVWCHTTRCELFLLLTSLVRGGDSFFE